MNNGCCEIEAIVSFDERGQLVIPKEVRKKFGLNAGDKFALISCTSNGPDGNPCCFTLMKTSELQGMVGAKLTPILEGIQKT